MSSVRVSNADHPSTGTFWESMQYTSFRRDASDVHAERRVANASAAIAIQAQPLRVTLFLFLTAVMVLLRTVGMTAALWAVVARTFLFLLRTVETSDVVLIQQVFRHFLDG